MLSGVKRNHEALEYKEYYNSVGDFSGGTLNRRAILKPEIGWVYS